MLPKLSPVAPFRLSYVLFTFSSFFLVYVPPCQLWGLSISGFPVAENTQDWKFHFSHPLNPGPCFTIEDYLVCGITGRNPEPSQNGTPIFSLNGNFHLGKGIRQVWEVRRVKRSPVLEGCDCSVIQDVCVGWSSLTASTWKAYAV